MLKHIFSHHNSLQEICKLSVHFEISRFLNITLSISQYSLLHIFTIRHLDFHLHTLSFCTPKYWILSCRSTGEKQHFLSIAKGFLDARIHMFLFSHMYAGTHNYSGCFFLCTSKIMHSALYNTDLNA